MVNKVMIDTAEPKDGSKSNFSKQDKYCEFCGAMLEQTNFEFGGVVRYVPSWKPCSCWDAMEKLEREKQEQRAIIEQEKILAAEKRKQERIKRLFGDSGMSRRALCCKFEGYQSTFDNHEALRTCNDYVKDFDLIQRNHRNGLFIVGNCGVGKSHLAYAVANALIEKNTSVICMTMIDLLLKIRSSFQSKEQTEEQILKIYEDCSLLIIDDLGKEKPSEWALQMIYTIIDRRYNAMKPIIVTTNYGANELIQRFTFNGDSSTGSAIVDRLFEMCEYLPIKGESYRKR